ncbi:hypothetical protein LQE92_06015 [Lacrimispora sp. NSJ-141]|uniref:Uncharacterized protein n=1 Tax=Lientehia hominis TaxID=2897778 RepID=A0AAP2RIU6_9FIRM|nr:hypothetical protein [Lientehia hominis]MCD2492183.1 hypothetical protein [Lientehia hominis]
MDSLKKVLHVCQGSLKRTVFKPRLYIAFLWFGFLIFDFIEKIKVFSARVNVPVSPWIFPFITTELSGQIFITLGAILIFCDAPFLSEGVYSQIIRCGRKNWFWGNMLYIWMQSLFYAVGLFLFSVILLMPKVEFMTGWGKVLGTLAQTNAASSVSLNQLEYSIISNFSPLQAVGLTLLAVWLNSVFIGVLSYVMNLLVKNGSGAVMGAIIALSPLLLTKLVQYEVSFYLAPPAWMNLAMYNWSGYGSYPSPRYMYTCLAFLIGVCTAVSYVGIRRKDLYIVKEL